MNKMQPYLIRRPKHSAIHTKFHIFNGFNTHRHLMRSGMIQDEINLEQKESKAACSTSHPPIRGPWDKSNLTLHANHIQRRAGTCSGSLLEAPNVF